MEKQSTSFSNSDLARAVQITARSHPPGAGTAWQTARFQPGRDRLPGRHERHGARQEQPVDRVSQWPEQRKAALLQPHEDLEAVLQTIMAMPGKPEHQR
ncbi:hypothetical protein [Candidatus Accumulibacter sp. ACC003]|uniref:hypothetical protein n=1 Tax=Candidatus Accumulibacter sp. ACC003 TaxID=2823334 RepID=UPI0025C2DCE3|nr:hypothetical protein [Candidatus Accumulibacter sp. ACC003]